MPTPERIFETMNAFQRTQALGAAIDLDLFSAIGEGVTTAKSLGERLGAAERGRSHPLRLPGRDRAAVEERRPVLPRSRCGGLSRPALSRLHGNCRAVPDVPGPEGSVPRRRRERCVGAEPVSTARARSSRTTLYGSSSRAEWRPWCGRRRSSWRSSRAACPRCSTSRRATASSGFTSRRRALRRRSTPSTGPRSSKSPARTRRALECRSG